MANRQIKELDLINNTDLNLEDVLVVDQNSGARSITVESFQDYLFSYIKKQINDPLIGSIQQFLGDLPEGYLGLNGQSVEVSDYPLLAEVVKNTAGFSVTETDIILPDYSGRFLRNTSSSVTLGTIQGDAIRNITGSFRNIHYQGSGRTPLNINQEGVFTNPDIGGNASGSGDQIGIEGNDGVGFDASKVVPTASENRPLNVSVTMAIKAL